MLFIGKKSLASSIHNSLKPSSRYIFKYYCYFDHFQPGTEAQVSESIYMYYLNQSLFSKTHQHMLSSKYCSLSWIFSSPWGMASVNAALLPTCHHSKNIKASGTLWCYTHIANAWSKTTHSWPDTYTEICEVRGLISGTWWSTGLGGFPVSQLSLHSLRWYFVLAKPWAFEQAVLLIQKLTFLFRKVNKKYISVYFSGIGRKSLKPVFCVALGFYIGLCHLYVKKLYICNFLLVYNCIIGGIKINFLHFWEIICLYNSHKDPQVLLI